MSIYINQLWPESDISAVCALQNTTGAANLLLNGTLANSITPNVISFLNAGFIRSVSLTSTNNLSAATFTITGTQNGITVTEPANGPNNNTVGLNTAFDTITSITVNQAVNGIRIGTGAKGYLPLIGLNTIGRIPMNWGISATTDNPNNVTYNVFQTLDKTLINSNIPFDISVLVDPLRFFKIIDAAQGPEIYQSQNAAVALLVQVDTTTAPLVTNLQVSFFQPC